jgi:5-methylcytosine-specific restriction protein A
MSVEELKPGKVIDNEQLCEIFGCSTQGGMRRSHTTNTLVIVSNHIKSIYDDRWVGDIFHYTGMGTQGDQGLDFAQNKTLAESNDNGVSVHLFEVFVATEYTYMGPVQLFNSPYFETQPDEDGQPREACVFPLKLINEDAPIISKDYADKPFEEKAKKARRLSDDEIKQRAQNAKKTIGVRNTISQQFDRNPWVSELAKRIANGVCQLCEEKAPFLKKSGEPYLETHHIVWLAKGGEDTIDNTVALCPNCHRKMHILNNDQDIQRLRKIKGA